MSDLGHDTPIGQRIAARRKALGMSLRELDRRSGVAVSYLSRLESRDHNPTLGVATRIAQALGVPLAVLTGEMDETEWWLFRCVTTGYCPRMMMRHEHIPAFAQRLRTVCGDVCAPEAEARR